MNTLKKITVAALAAGALFGLSGMTMAAAAESAPDNRTLSVESESATSTRHFILTNDTGRTLTVAKVQALTNGQPSTFAPGDTDLVDGRQLENMAGLWLEIQKPNLSSPGITVFDTHSLKITFLLANGKTSDVVLTVNGAGTRTAYTAPSSAVDVEKSGADVRLLNRVQS